MDLAALGFDALSRAGSTRIERKSRVLPQVNLVYVAATRAQRRLFLNQDLARLVCGGAPRTPAAGLGTYPVIRAAADGGLVLCEGLSRLAGKMARGGHLGSSTFGTALAEDLGAAGVTSLVQTRSGDEWMSARLPRATPIATASDLVTHRSTVHSSTEYTGGSAFALEACAALAEGIS